MVSILVIPIVLFILSHQLRIPVGLDGGVRHIGKNAKQHERRNRSADEHPYGHELARLDWFGSDEAVRLAPDDPIVLWTRADFLRARGRGDSGEADFAKAKALRAKKIEFGLIITELVDAGAAQKAGLRTNDIILKVGAKRVRTFEELAAALADAKGSIDALILRGDTGKRETVALVPSAGKIGVAVEPVEAN